ncbi:hypothetical protein C1645_832443 [Glomus cerebriforme]|uniref:Uncharacterized protein n=1 Tax=Glomus cerebriforme TaxID=658196 RepID=A0A397SHE9_9GLOM|nr:hypothetical protein C1645_832443 [Glomus cerebriforme]
MNDEVIKKHFSEIELQEIEEVPSPKIPDYLSQDVIEYLNKFINKNTTNDMHVVLNEWMTSLIQNGCLHKNCDRD